MRRTAILLHLQALGDDGLTASDLADVHGMSAYEMGRMLRDLRGLRLVRRDGALWMAA